MRIRLVLLLLALTIPGAAQILRAGVATGFPPYQFAENGRPAGLDVELAEAIAKEAGFQLVWTQDRWDELTSLLRLSNDLDLLTGMEQTGERERAFLFTKPLYQRRNLLFVLVQGPRITRLEDLDARKVARDRDAFSDELLSSKGLKNGIRLVRTDSKEAAFAELAAGRVDAAFMPEAVGWTLARQAGVAVRTVDLGDPGTPVGLAFRRDHGALVERMNMAISRLEKNGVLGRIYDRYRVPRLQ